MLPPAAASTARRRGAEATTILTLLALLVAATALAPGSAQARGADLVFHNGPVLTVDPRDTVAEALAVRDGVILAVGGAREVLALRDAHTQVVDLQGRALLPGFVAAHEHPAIASVFAGATDLSGFTHKSDAEVWAELRRAVAATPRGQWIYGRGLDPMLVPDLRIPDRKGLDAIAPDHPLVLVSQSMHSFWANSKAFEAAGIGKDTPDPGHGAFYERDAAGDLTGFVSEPAAARPLLGPLRSPWALFRRYEAQLDDYLAGGITSVASLGINVPPLLARFAASRNFQPRIRQFDYLAEDELSWLPSAPDHESDWFRVLGVKLWHDGSPYTGSMYMAASYLDTPLTRTLGIPAATRGSPMIGHEALVEAIRKYTAAGWQVAIHSQGDASNREVMDAVEAAAPLQGVAPVVRLEHGVLLPEELLPKLARFGVTASFHVNHLLYYGDDLADAILGDAVTGHALPIARAASLGLRPTLHADSPMFPARPFSLMRTAVTRQTSSGRIIGPAQALTVRQALRASTIDAAWQLRMEDKLGSLEPGKLADLQVVPRHPYEVPPQELDALAPQAVYVGGRLEWPRS